MAISQGACPNCGAPLTFELGASMAKVCEYCRNTVVRNDRGFETLGKVSDLAHIPSLIAVGDEGKLAERAFKVMGRVQLDYGKGPWDEYYVAFDQGATWGWLAYAQGLWYTTTLAESVPLPRYETLSLELQVELGSYGRFCIAELRSARVFSTEGELPAAFQAEDERYYADAYGPGGAFATLDYGKAALEPALFVGRMFRESELELTELGPRSIRKIQTTTLRCPNCGGDVPSLSGERAERLGCPYCGAVSDIAAQRVILAQQTAREKPDIPLGSRGSFHNQEYVCIAYLRRSLDLDGERYGWEEYLLWSRAEGFRWLVNDPEAGFSFVSFVSPAEVERMGPATLRYSGRVFRERSRGLATVEYVLGEVYWKCEIGEETRIQDFVSGSWVLSREVGEGEVHYSQARPISWVEIAKALNLPGGRFSAPISARRSGLPWVAIILLILLVLLLLLALSTCHGSRPRTGWDPVLRSPSVFHGGK